MKWSLSHFSLYFSRCIIDNTTDNVSYGAQICSLYKYAFQAKRQTDRQSAYRADTMIQYSEYNKCFIFRDYLKNLRILFLKGIILLQGCNVFLHLGSVRPFIKIYIFLRSEGTLDNKLLWYPDIWSRYGFFSIFTVTFARLF